VLSKAHEADLLDAVPSFKERWRLWLADQAEYEQNYPDAVMTSAERTSEFLFQLAHHLGPTIARGDLAEAQAVFAALEPVYAMADEALVNALTIGFLESVIYAIQGTGGEAAVLHEVPKPARSEREWQTAFGYLHPERAAKLWGA